LAAKFEEKKHAALTVHKIKRKKPLKQFNLPTKVSIVKILTIPWTVNLLLEII
jgi:hypothetical protein